MKFTDMGDLRPAIYQLVRTLFLNLEATDRQLMDQFNLSVTQYWALVYLEDPEGLPLSELALLLIRDKSNMTSLVDKLEKAGLAIRKYGKNGDRRYIRVSLTEQGRRLRSQVIASHDDLINMRLENLAEESLRELRTLLQALSDELQLQLEEGKVSGLIEAIVQQSASSTKMMS